MRCDVNGPRCRLLAQAMNEALRTASWDWLLEPAPATTAVEFDGNLLRHGCILFSRRQAAATAPLLCGRSGPNTLLRT